MYGVFMFVRKNYYLYAENAEKQNEKKKLLGSVRLTRIEEQWTMEIQWKDENDAAALVSKAEEEELQFQIKEKEIIFRQINRDLREDAADTNADKTEEQELAVTATENIRKEDKQEEDKQEEDKQEREEQQRKLQIRTGGEDRGHQIDQEWEQIRSSCHKVEDCRELGEVYRVNKGNFAVLPESMKHILQNSFLVHGLMNYGYLLLFRVDEKARQFGVGVPGVYYEKEKLVAEMFGFPQFWCDGRSDNGKFGYYLRIVS
ncbi:MAG TPA: hypothetical protein DEW33_07360 [Lachnospiraceae bacterium]|nr:hypothetical protein [Lachnospiraceae bacterium]